MKHKAVERQREWGMEEEAAQGWGTSVKAPMSSKGGGGGYEYQA